MDRPGAAYRRGCRLPLFGAGEMNTQLAKKLLDMLRTSCPEVTIGGKSPGWVFYPHLGQPFNWSVIPGASNSERDALLSAIEFHNWLGRRLADECGEDWRDLTPL